GAGVHGGGEPGRRLRATGGAEGAFQRLRRAPEGGGGALDARAGRGAEATLPVEEPVSELPDDDALYRSANGPERGDGGRADELQHRRRLADDPDRLQATQGKQVPGADVRGDRRERAEAGQAEVRGLPGRGDVQAQGAVGADEGDEGG